MTTAVVNAGAPEAEFVGRVEAVASFDARPRVEGTVQQVAFQEGQSGESAIGHRPIPPRLS